MDTTVDNDANASVKDTEDRNYEAEASKMGWKPETEFKGDKAKWIDAKSFVARGEEVLPIVKAELKKTRAELDEFRKTAQEFAAFNEAAREREVSEWKAKYEEAVRSKSEAITQGDGAAAIEADAKLEELKANRPEPKKEVLKPDPEFSAWHADNDWYGKDDERTLQANLIAASISKKQGLKGRALYDAVSEKLGEFEAVASGKARTGSQRGGKVAAETKGARTYENLKPEFREQCDRQFKFFGGKGTEEAWRKSWVSKADNELFRS
jgi:hypothetical protein